MANGCPLFRAEGKGLYKKTPRLDLDKPKTKNDGLDDIAEEVYKNLKRAPPHKD